MEFESIVNRSPEKTKYLIKPGILKSGEIADILKNQYPKHNFFICCDSNTYKFGKTLNTQLNSYSDTFDIAKAIHFPAGEQSKNEETYFSIANMAKTFEMKKNLACFVALGGGVVTDMTLFVAATYVRGTTGISIPTTLLAQVDAGIGGKNGIDLGEWKNYLGTIKQPAYVFSDSSLLKKLNNDQYSAGLAEAIKTALIFDKNLFELFANEKESIEDKNADVLNTIIQKCTKYKVSVIEEDPEEKKNLRHLLNLGHTIGHAIELKSELLHGQAVSIGIVGAYFIAKEKGTCTEDELNSVIETLRYFELPTGITKDLKISKSEIIKNMKSDKKATSTINMVIPNGIGQLYNETTASFDEKSGKYKSTLPIEEKEIIKTIDFLASM